MKKSLIALAALAAVGAASAQSSVTLYGLVDIGYGAQQSDQRAGPLGTVSVRSGGVMDGPQAGNRIGFRGVEDLGGGLKANFVIEQGISPTGNGGGLFTARAATAGQQLSGLPGAVYAGFANNTGANGAIPAASTFSASTNRQTYLGLSSASMGTVNIGYQYTNLYELSTLSGYNLGTEGMPGAATSHVFGSSYLGGTRSNGITYISPAIFGGFSVRAQYGALGANMISNNAVNAANLTTPNNGTRFGLMGQYANGPLSASLAYTNARVNNAATLSTSRTGNLTQFGASYDFGVAKLAGTYNTGRDGGIGAASFVAAPGTSTAYRSYQLGVSAPFGAFVPFITYGRAYATTDGAGAKVIDVKQTQVGVRYSLSKRTTAYAFYGNAIDNAAQSTVASIAAATAGSVYRDRKTVVGVAHSF